VALHQERATTTLLRWTGKLWRCSRRRRAAAAHPRPGGNSGCMRRGRHRQRWRWPRGTRVISTVARGAVVSGDVSHARRGRLCRPSTTNSSDPVAWAASFDLAASGSSSGDELSDPCLCHRWLYFMPATYTIYAFQWWFLHRWIRFYVAIKLSLISAGVVSWTDIRYLLIMVHGVCIYATLYMNLCSAWTMSSYFLHACSGNENIIQNFRPCNGNSNSLP
jgi:hypothetical protein